MIGPRILPVGGHDPSLNVRALNEVLFCHERPAAISRYQICMGEAQESQKSSGLWVSSAAGSSGAIYSAGGKLMPIGSRRLQYKPRELFRGECIDYELKGGFVDGQEGLTINSEMREGVIYVDGCHSKIDFPYGSTVTVMNSLTPLRVVLDPSGNHFRDRAGKL